VSGLFDRGGRVDLLRRGGRGSGKAAASSSTL